MERLLWALLMLVGRIEQRVPDRRARLREAFWTGVLRGVGAMLGAAVVGTALVYALQFVAARSLPGISDFLAEIVSRVQAQTGVR